MFTLNINLGNLLSSSSTRVGLGLSTNKVQVKKNKTSHDYYYKKNQNLLGQYFGDNHPEIYEFIYVLFWRHGLVDFMHLVHSIVDLVDFMYLVHSLVDLLELLIKLWVKNIWCLPKLTSTVEISVCNILWVDCDEQEPRDY